MLPIYIIHYTPLVERRLYLEEVLPNAEWITDVTNKENLTDKMTQEWYHPDQDAWREKCTGYYAEVPPFKIQEPGHICCSLGHIDAWQTFLNSEEPLALFLEDDIVLFDNFLDNLYDVSSYAPKTMDALFIGGGFHHTIAKTKRVYGNYHLKDNPATNCLCSYILTRQCAEKILRNIKPFTVPIDFELNYWFDKLNLNVFHHLPYIAIEGTSLGRYKSVQR